MSFALFLLLLIVLTGLVWLLEKYFLRARRAKDARQPWWVEYSISFFPVILVVVCCARSSSNRSRSPPVR